MLFFTPLSTPYNTTNPSSTYPKPSPSLPSSFPASYLTHTNQMFSPGPIPNFPIPTPNLPCRSPQAFTSKLTLPPEQTSPNLHNSDRISPLPWSLSWLLHVGSNLSHP